MPDPTQENPPGNGAPPVGGPPGQPSRRRYVVSQLLSLHPSEQDRAAAAERFSARLESALLPNVDVVKPPRGAAKRDAGESGRRVVVFEADPAELQAKTRELTDDTVIEPELIRTPALAFPEALTGGVSPAAAATGAGDGATLSLTLRDPQGGPVAAATMIARFQSLQTPGVATVSGGVSNAEGNVSTPFDPNVWRPALVAIQPAGGYWTLVVATPQSGQLLTLRPLPTGSPFGWWQLLSGALTNDPLAGSGVRVGVIDSGVGPHPYLEHAVPIGAFVDGAQVLGESAGRDVQTHGTHVSGIIGARPPAASGAFAGVAPGADLLVARIFSATGGGNQGDIANALGALSEGRKVDVINMSLTGPPSAIEHDAIILAWRRGTICICAAGNQNGSPVGYPAAYPECVAVSALGLANAAPADSMPGWNLPSQPDRWSAHGAFLARFSNFGSQIDVTAPGNGVISTVPTRPGFDAPYVDMSGTSMASPMVAGVLARLLSVDKAWAEMPRDGWRAARARDLLYQHALSLGLAEVYEGAGLARML